MKKSLLSVILCVAVLFSAVSAMFVMPATAADDIDLLASKGGSLTVSGAAGTVEEWTIDAPATVEAKPFIDFAVESDALFEITFVDEDGKNIGIAADFCNNGNYGDSTTAGILAGTYAVKQDLRGAYTWASLPQDKNIVKVKVELRAEGTLTISKMVQTDGIVPVNVDTASYADNAAWETTSLLAAEGWGSADSDNGGNISSAVVEAAGNGIVVSSTNGDWPAATLNFAAPVVANWETDAIYVNYTITQTSRLMLFYGQSTVDNWESEEFVDLGTGTAGDLPAGKYVGTLMLKDIIPAASVAEDGTVTLNSLKIFAIGSGNCVTVDAINLLTVPAVEETTTTTEEPTTTTTTTEEPTTTTEAPTTTTTEAAVETDGYCTITVETVTATGTIAAGEKVEVSVMLSETANISGFDFKLVYDTTYLTYDSTVKGDILSNFGVNNLNTAVKENLVTHEAPLMEMWGTGLNPMGSCNAAEGDVLYTIVFVAAQDITADTAIELFFASATETDPDTFASSEHVAAMVNGGIVIEAEETTTTTEPTTTTTTEPTTTTTEPIVETDGYCTITVETVTATGMIAAGEEIEISVMLSETANISGFDFKLTYDTTYLTYKETLKGDILSNFGVNNLNTEVKDNLVTHEAPLKEMWGTGLNPMGSCNAAEGDVLYTIVFVAAQDITEDTAINLFFASATETDPDTFASSEHAAAMVNGGIVIEAEETTTTTEPTTTTTVVDPVTTTTTVADDDVTTTTTVADDDVTTTTTVADDNVTTTTTVSDSDVTTTTTTGSSSPVTGDSTNAIVFIVVALIAAGAVVLTVASKKVTAR